jgi:hypothetical protein
VRVRACVFVCLCNSQSVLLLAENKKSILKNKLTVILETITCWLLIYWMLLVQNVEHNVKNASLSLLMSWMLIWAGAHKFPKIYKPPKNSRHLKGDIKQIPYWGPTNIRHHHKKCSCSGHLGFVRHCVWETPPTFSRTTRTNTIFPTSHISVSLS